MSAPALSDLNRRARRDLLFQRGVPAERRVPRAARLPASEIALRRAFAGIAPHGVRQALYAARGA